VSLLVALTAALAASLIGTVVGLISGYSEGWGDIVLSRVIEAQLSLPVILVALSIAISLGPSFRTTVLAIAITSWVPYARVVRSEVLVLKRSDFTALAIVTGLRSSKILWRHILPNVLPSVVVLATQNFGQAIVYEAGLSFLGIGVQPPDVSWGLMIAQSYLYIISVPWLVLAPAFALALTALSTNLLGDIIRDRLDPTLSPVQ
jgi:peptide/nickel transport system permease protein